MATPLQAPRRTRAAALPPEERRAAIVAAVTPLVLQQGRNVTTRQIAEAAGIAEGTIFRAFADKDELIDTVIDAAFDAGPDVEALERIPVELPLEERLVSAVEVLQRRATRLWAAMTAAGVTQAARRPRARDRSEPPEIAPLTRLLAPDAARLRLPPDDVARRARSITFATTLPVLAQDRPASAAEIVSLLLDGVRAR